MSMQLEIEEEYNQFLEDIKDPGFIFGRYMNVCEYEDEYSHNEIGEAAGILAEKIRTYLHENRPDEFIVGTDYCVRVMTPERARQANISERTIDLRIVR